MKPDRSVSAACAAVFFTPIAGVLLARFIGAAVGTTAGAQVPAPPASIATLPPFTTRADRTGSLVSMPSPFRPIDETAAREITGSGETAPRGVKVPAFALTAVMPHPQRPIAVINGRPRTTGEELSPGWTLADIDGPGRTVVIQGPDGDRIRIRMGNQSGGL